MSPLYCVRERDKIYVLIFGGTHVFSILRDLVLLYEIFVSEIAPSLHKMISPSLSLLLL